MLRMLEAGKAGLCKTQTHTRFERKVIFHAQNDGSREFKQINARPKHTHDSNERSFSMLRMLETGKTGQ